jgi:hypothetical protein
LTYCVGFVKDDTAFLVADSAVTSPSAPTTTHSSFGELHDKIRGDYVFEGAMKIVKLGDGAAAAFSGDLNQFLPIANFLRDNIRRVETIPELFKSMTLSIGPFFGRAAVILATSSAAGASLYHWDSDSGRLKSGDDFYTIGSIQALREYTPSITRIVHGVMKMEGHRLLNTTVALIQSYGVRNAMFQENIGGTIYGLLTHGGTTEWQRDTETILYDDDLKSFTRARWAIIEDSLVVVSSATKRCHAFATLDPIDLAQWTSSIHDKIAARLYSDQPSQIVWLHTLRWSITVMDGAPGSEYEASRFVRIQDDGEMLSISIKPELVDALRMNYSDQTSHPFFYFVP